MDGNTSFFNKGQFLNEEASISTTDGGIVTFVREVMQDS